MPTVALVASPEVIDPGLLSTVAGVLQAQVTNDLAQAPPHGWGVAATVVAAPVGQVTPPNSYIIRITATITNPDVVGYHYVSGTPGAIVQYSDQTEDWVFYTSHELLEMLVDPFGQTRHDGPSIDPQRPGTPVAYLVEICDPVQDPSMAYKINGYHVSNFVLPTFYQTPRGLPYDRCNKLSAPFEPALGGCITWGDPALNSWMQFKHGDATATAGPPLSSPPPGMTDAEFAALPSRELVHQSFGRHLIKRLSDEQIAQSREERATLARVREHQLKPFEELIERLSRAQK